MFVGGTCEDTPLASVHTFKLSTGAWTQNVFNANLGFTRKNGETFQAWTDVESRVWNRPEAMLSDIVFDGQDLVLGIRDRYADKTGFNALTTNLADNATRYSTQTAGEVLRACVNTAGTGWNLEQNGTCGPITTAGAGNADGPGGGEYYFDDHLIFFNYSGGSLVRTIPMRIGTRT